MKKQPVPQPMHCPLCKSQNVRAFKVGWARVVCMNTKCGCEISKAMPLAELIAIWNTREPVQGTLTLTN